MQLPYSEAELTCGTVFTLISQRVLRSLITRVEMNQLGTFLSNDEDFLLF